MPGMVVSPTNFVHFLSLATQPTPPKMCKINRSGIIIIIIIIIYFDYPG